ncbi:hypothetical protein [Sphingobium sp. CFD-1]|uniref:hypothetical protein n=1 Tax=Sphingobium sp. CFD-1 TaxID=2878545 RepID=UPI00214AA953|nr:hypothetical protein [Sphingobium sp. CFD-1]
MARADSNFIPLPDLPTGTSPELAALLDRIKVAYLSDEDEITDDWFPAKREVAAFASRNGADIAVKLMVALHEIGPGRDGDRIGYRPGDFCTDLSMDLIASAMNDVLTVQFTFIRILVDHMRQNYVSLFLGEDSELRVAFPEPGICGRPERSDILDNIDGAMRALCKLMCAVPGATKIVRGVVAEARP